MFIHKLAALSAVVVLGVRAMPHTPTTPVAPPSSNGTTLNNEDGCAPFEYLAPPMPATPMPLTNSQRLARGLAIRPPTPVQPDGRDSLPSALPLDRRQGGIPSSLPLGRRQGGIPSALPLGRRQGGIPSALPLGRRQGGTPSGLPLPRRQLPSAVPLGRRQGVPSILPRGMFPVHSHHGNVRVEFAENRTVAGYIAKKLNSFNEYSLTKNMTDAVPVQIDTDRQSEDSFNIVATKPANPTLVNIGAVIGPKSTSASLSEGSNNYAILVGSDETKPGAPPSKGQTTAYGGAARESAIWKIDPLSKELTAHWVNEDSTTPATSILFVEDYFVLTGDQSAVDAAFSVHSAQILFFLEH